MARRGFFLTFEGADGTGKSTQIRLLTRALQSRKIDFFLTREPGGTPLGEKFRKLLRFHEMSLTTELLLMEAARAELVSQEILPRLEKGQVVISDRYQESTLVYQSYVKGIPAKLAKELNRIATGGLDPDFIILLDSKKNSNEERVRNRGREDRFEREKSDFHKKVVLGYRKLVKSYRSDPKRKNKIHVYDADLSRKEIHEMILEDVIKKLRRKGCA